MRVLGPTEMPITIPQEGNLRISPTTESAANAEGPSFERIFGRTIEEANSAQRTAMEKADALARGAQDDLHGTMISVKEAEISLKLVGSIRNKLLDAFHELWRTSV